MGSLPLDSSGGGEDIVDVRLWCVGSLVAGIIVSYCVRESTVVVDDLQAGDCGAVDVCGVVVVEKMEDSLCDEEGERVKGGDTRRTRASPHLS